MGRVDACIQSTDKNFLVPVGGAVICGPEKAFVQAISKMYPGRSHIFFYVWVATQGTGRASNAPALDLFITMLHLGRRGYKALLDERKRLVPYFHAKLMSVATAHGERVLETRHNDVQSVYASVHVLMDV